MHITNCVLLLSTLWYIKSSTLTKLYFRLKDRRNVEVRDFRRLEKAGLKLTKLRLDLKYFRDCLELNVCPKFLQIKTPDLKAFKNNNRIFKSIILNQIDEIKNDLRHAESLYQSLKERICNQLSLMEKRALIHLLNASYERRANTILLQHQKKLICLWKSQRFRSPNCLINLSRRKLSPVEENVLRCGLNNHILPNKINSDEMKMNIEKVMYSLANNNNVPVCIDDNFKDEVKFCVNNFLKRSENLCNSNINQSFHLTCKQLANDHNIKICKFDKGSGIAVLNSDDYFTKLDSIVNDQHKFIKVLSTGIGRYKKHPIIAREDLIARKIKTIFKKCVDEDIYKKLTPSGSNPGEMYGMCVRFIKMAIHYVLLFL